MRVHSPFLLPCQLNKPIVNMFCNLLIFWLILFWPYFMLQYSIFILAVTGLTVWAPSWLLCPSFSSVLWLLTQCSNDVCSAFRFIRFLLESGQLGWRMCWSMSCQSCPYIFIRSDASWGFKDWAWVDSPKHKWKMVHNRKLKLAI